MKQAPFPLKPLFDMSIAYNEWLFIHYFNVFSDSLLDERPHKKRVVLSRFPQASENNTFYQLRFF
ncbi:hypothetical protein D3D03_12755 [Exiguobacterium sp. RIT452]|nr:hypothetical protein D3D03_12755 [Exiguobacterium sp. RIT452]